MAVDPRVERGIGRICRAQNGAVTWNQLLAAGLTPAEVKTRVGRGALHRAYRGVYTIGDPALLPRARESAALLSVAGMAVLSHRSGAALWSLAERPSKLIDVTVVGRKARHRPSVRLHRVSRLDPKDISSRSNLAVTSPARTLVDFAADASGGELEHALAEAIAQRLVTEEQLHEATNRAPVNHTGAAIMRSLLAHQAGMALTRSPAERKLLPLIIAAQLPAPQVNAHVCGYMVDLYWPDHALVVEVDGYQFHRSRAMSESDRKRDQVLVAAGYRVIRVTWRQLVEEPLAVIARIVLSLRADAA